MKGRGKEGNVGKVGNVRTEGNEGKVSNVAV
jgi:hypothetical protein